MVFLPLLHYSLFVILKSVSPPGRTDANTRTSRKKYGCSLTWSASQATDRKPVQKSCSAVPLPNTAAMPTYVRAHRLTLSSENPRARRMHLGEVRRREEEGRRTMLSLRSMSTASHQV